MRKIIYIALAALTLTFAACKKSSSNEPDLPKVAPEGAVNGIFSVGPKTKVWFSKGNLWMQTNFVTMQSMWKFADNQYNIIGSTQSLWKEFFAWTEIAENTGDFKDWKNSSILNGNNGKTTWHVMTKDEWEYLFRFRNNNNADSLFAPGTVMGVYGLIVLPDKWTKPEGVEFTSAKENGAYWDVDTENDYQAYALGDVSGYDNNYNTSAKWKAMEDAGAVFLPAAGTNTGNLMYSGQRCYYWSSSTVGSGSSRAYHIYFSEYSLKPADDRCASCYDMSLRLVTNVK